MPSTNVAQIAPTSWQEDSYTPEVLEAIPFEDDFLTDHYEILRISTKADEETIERVYQTLADRFHPDNLNTGDAKTYARIQEAYETLSDPARRAAPRECYAPRRLSAAAA